MKDVECTEGYIFTVGDFLWLLTTFEKNRAEIWVSVGFSLNSDFPDFQHDVSLDFYTKLQIWSMKKF